MRVGAIQIPDDLLNGLRDHNLVIFAGAGVSLGAPANLPDFKRLALLIAEGTGETPLKNEMEDRFLGRLQHMGVDVHTRAVNALSRTVSAPTALHSDLLHLFHTIDRVRMVTTNFDLLFEQAAEELFGAVPEVYRAPALPLGRSFSGIVHVHGSIHRPENIVLTDADFGRAYLTEGWARRFLVEMFRVHTALFVGYSHNDVIVQYLARALPEHEAGRRYALIPESDDPKRWMVLGIGPITYPRATEEEHTALYQGLHLLSNLVNRSILDWKRELADLATKPPPLDEAEASQIEHALKEVATIHFFTDHARLPEWLNWMDSRHCLDALFGEGKLEERDGAFAFWVAKHYAVNYAHEVQLLIGKHGMRLHPAFWWILTREIALGEDERLDEPILSRWVSLLLASSPTQPDKSVMLLLGQRCAKNGAFQSLLQIFDVMSNSSLVLKQGFSLGDDETEEAKHRIDVELPFIADHYVLNELWENGLKPYLEHVVSPLLSLLVHRIEEKHFKMRAWQKADREWDDMSEGRSAIDLNDQYPKPIDVLIDAGRDCLEWMLINRASQVASWCELLANKQVPLLRRLAVHAVGLRTDISADEKLYWLVEQVGLHDEAAHHEIYRAVRQAYPAASIACRARVIESVLSYRWANEKNSENERNTASVHFEWLHGLHDAEPDCEQTKRALNDVIAKHPDFEHSKHPDLTHRISSGWYGPHTPWTADELLEKEPSDWLADLLKFQGNYFHGPDRAGLRNAVTEAVKKNFCWSLNLASALAKGNHWDSDLWPNLIGTWSHMDLDEAAYHETMAWLGRPELYAKHFRPIVDGLYVLVRDGGKPYAFPLLSAVNEIAASIWECLDRSESRDESDNWLRLAISRPAGTLAKFWLGSLSIWRKHQDVKPANFSEDYRRSLTSIVKDQSLHGRLGRTIFASQFPFLLSVDESWTRVHLLPLFDTESDTAEFQAAWDGFLTWGYLNPPVATAMENAFFKALPRLVKDNASRKERFVKFYTTFTGYFAENPMNTWIPPLFRYGDMETRRLFASNVGHQLRGMDEAQQLDWWQRWIKQYWVNRLQGVPALLEVGEIEQMLDWLLHLSAVFPEAVDIAIRMPQAPMQRSLIVYEMKKSELVHRHPKSVARLLIYLDCTGSPRYIFHGLPEVIERLKQTDLDEPLKQELEKLLSIYG